MRRISNKMMDYLLRECYNNAVVMNPKFPIAEKFGGNLKWNATKVEIGGSEWAITISKTIAPYVDFLEYGTEPHLIQNAFGRGITVLHPGSKKHKGFISQGMTNITVNTIIQLTRGREK